MDPSVIHVARARLDADALLSVKDIAVLHNCSTKTVWRLVHDGRFPSPTHRPTQRTVRWDAATVRGAFETASHGRRRRAA
jgi:predicted DNA-binding transcriptional regulator AlpA